MMEDRDFLPAALKALEPEDWTRIASALTSREGPLRRPMRLDAVRTRILQLELEAEAERFQVPCAAPFGLARSAAILLGSVSAGRYKKRRRYRRRS
jgi:hypothetical protein